MFKLRLAVVVAAASLVALMSASVAQADYEDAAVTINLDSSTVIGGGQLSGTVTSNGAPCAWTATFNGVVQAGSGTSFSFSFPTPVVTVKTTKTLTVTCKYDDGNVAQSSVIAGNSNSVQNASFVRTPTAVLPAAIQTLSRSVTVTLLPKSAAGSGSNNGALPSTGGPNGLLIGGGVALLVVGAGAVLVARRKGAQAA